MINHEQFLVRMEKIRPNVKVLGTYVNSKKLIKCKCKVCKYEWEAVPTTLHIKSMCLKCAIIQRWKTRKNEYESSGGIS